jgi:hypothetical protein
MDKATQVFNKLAQDAGKWNNAINSRIMKNRVTQSNGRFTGTSVMRFNTAGGVRYYSGKGSSLSMQGSLDAARRSANLKFRTSPADSMTTQQFKKFK